MMGTTQAFDKIYRKVSINKNYAEPNYPRLDNWSIDTWTDGEWFALMSDAGYSRAVGKKANGKVLWRVDEDYGKPYRFSGITEQGFQEVADKL